jgi:hypothetical protein
MSLFNNRCNSVNLLTIDLSRWRLVPISAIWLGVRRDREL